MNECFFSFCSLTHFLCFPQNCYEMERYLKDEPRGKGGGGGLVGSRGRLSDLESPWLAFLEDTTTASTSRTQTNNNNNNIYTQTSKLTPRKSISSISRQHTKMLDNRNSSSSSIENSAEVVSVKLEPMEGQIDIKCEPFEYDTFPYPQVKDEVVEHKFFIKAEREDFEDHLNGEFKTCLRLKKFYLKGTQNYFLLDTFVIFCKALIFEHNIKIKGFALFFHCL